MEFVLEIWTDQTQAERVYCVEWLTAGKVLLLCTERERQVSLVALSPLVDGAPGEWMEWCRIQLRTWARQLRALPAPDQGMVLCKLWNTAPLAVFLVENAKITSVGNLPLGEECARFDVCAAAGKTLLAAAFDRSNVVAVYLMGDNQRRDPVPSHILIKQYFKSTNTGCVVTLADIALASGAAQSHTRAVVRRGTAGGCVLCRKRLARLSAPGKRQGAAGSAPTTRCRGRSARE